MRLEAACVALLSLAVADATFAQSVDEIVEKNLKAKGGIRLDYQLSTQTRVMGKFSKATIFERPRHPYTLALMASTPAVMAADRRQKIAVKGELPSPLDPPPGCAFHRRCPRATPSWPR